MNQLPVKRDSTRQIHPLECSLTSMGITRLSCEEVNALRKKSAELPGELGYSVLRHVDEQTLACLAAVKGAIDTFDECPASYDQWGIVASSRYLGRSSFAQTLTKYAQEGPWNVSVQVVPNRSLHSPASTVGLALGCHGPCVGVGGGLDGETDAWLTALTLLDQHQLPGLWLIFCGWEPDEQVNIEGVSLNNAKCTAIALALQPASSARRLADLQLTFDPAAPSVLPIPATRTAMSQIEQFAALENPDLLSIPLGGCLSARMKWSSAARVAIPLPTLQPVVPRKAA